MAETDKTCHRPFQANQMGNITRVVLIDWTDPSMLDAEGNYTDEFGFFIRAATEGSLKYCPIGNPDDEAITKTFEASEIFVDPEICRKIFATGAGSPMAEDIYVGYGV